MKKVKNGKVEAVIYHWFIQKRSAVQSVSGLVLCEKASMFNQQLVEG
jgi:hypothetical protein